MNKVSIPAKMKRSKKISKQIYRKNLEADQRLEKKRLDTAKWVETLPKAEKKSSYVPVEDRIPAKVHYEVMEKEDIKEYCIGRTPQLQYAVCKFIEDRFSTVIRWFPDEDSAYLCPLLKETTKL